MTDLPAVLLGAHVSIKGGLELAPERGRSVGANVIQIFTKTPNQWREPEITAEEAEAFKTAVGSAGLVSVVSHDSYLINLASPDRRQLRRSIKSFKAELERCRTLGIPHIVSHPGNYLTRRKAGLIRNAASYRECLEAVPGPTVLLETTAGTGTALGSRFEELAELSDRIGPGLEDRIGFCADTCHLFSAGYDLRDEWERVWLEWEEVLGLERLRCIHLNDSKTPFGSRRDRHELIAEGTLGPEPFRSVMTDPRLQSVVKIIETPKGDDQVRTDRRMLRRLKAYSRAKR